MNGKVTRNLSQFFAKNSRILTLVCCIFGLVLPLIFKNNAYILRVASTCLMYVILALGLNVITGYMGQTSFGTAAFFGIGSYVGAIFATRVGMDTGLIFIIAPVISGIISLLLGACVLKLKGYYMAIVTLGFCEIVRLIELNWMSLTRGPLGISGIPKMSFFGMKADSKVEIYYVVFVMLILVTYIVWRLMNSRFGLVITSIRDDEIATQSMGINIVKYKIYAFVIYGMICGFAGAFYAQFMSYIDPTMFKTVNSTEVVIMVIFGGLASIPGSYLGAIALTVLNELLRDMVEYRMLIYGVILVIMMIVKPEGILGDVNLKHIRQRQIQKQPVKTAKGVDTGNG